MEKLIQARWEELERKCIPDDVPKSLRKRMREAFFMGAMNLYDMQLQVKGTKEEKIKNGTALMVAVGKELIEFEKEVEQEATEIRKGAH